jgi:hypothetical protein
MKMLRDRAERRQEEAKTKEVARSAPMGNNPRRHQRTKHCAEFVKGKRRRQAPKRPKEETGKASMREKICNQRSRHHEGRHIDRHDVK